MPLSGKKHSFFGRTVEGKQILLSSIDYIGRENGNIASSFAVQEWSDSTVAKKFSINNKYGNAGYYQIRPGSTDIFEAAALNNDLGISAGTSPTLYSKPAFANVVGGAGNYVNFSPYANYKGPDGISIYRQGALSVSVNNGPFNSPSGPGTGYFGIVAQITLTRQTRFILGVAVDSVGPPGPGETLTYSPKYVGVFSPLVGGTVFSASMPRNGIPRMPFFLIQGVPGENFIVSAWQDAGTQSVSATSLLTFDVIDFY